jgi:hypothetical protein
MSLPGIRWQELNIWLKAPSEGPAADVTPSPFARFRKSWQGKAKGKSP